MAAVRDSFQRLPLLISAKSDSGVSEGETDHRQRDKSALN